MPHDFQHFIVERTLGIEDAVFGQLAAGGTAGTFTWSEPVGLSAPERGAQARWQASQAYVPDDAMRSERATYICWHTGSVDRLIPSIAPKRVMEKTARSMLEAMSADERALYSLAKLGKFAPSSTD